MKKSILAVILAIGICINPVSIYAASSDDGTVTIEDLQKQIEELQKENDELKKQLGASTEAPAEAPIELAEDIASADTTVEYTDVNTVQMVQMALNDAGFNCGTADGKAGTKTREQITQYQTANGLTANGLITEQLILSLGLADKVAENAKLEAEKATYSSDYSYDQLARTPDTYEGQKVKFSGTVLQVTEDTENGLAGIRLSINSNYDTIYGIYSLSDLDYRLLENDKITIYGVASGIYTYTAVRGNSVSIPLVIIQYIDLN